YDNDEILVPKNTSVIVARIPVATGNKKTWDKQDLPLPIDDDDLGQIRYDRIVKNADLVNANTTEEDKVKAMITQSSQEYDPSKYVKSRSMTGPLPPTYTCYRCGKQGHWIKDCPTNNVEEPPDVKRSTGIPRSFMVPVDGPEHRGALLTSTGDYAVPLIDHQAYKEVKKEKPPFVPQDEPVVQQEAQIREELLCMVCKDLLQDAVLIPCCGNSFCDECVRQVLLESDNHECPVCHDTDVSPNTLIPNRFLRTAVLNFKNETGYTRARHVILVKSPPSISQSVESPQPSPDSTVESHPTEIQSAHIQNDDNVHEEHDGPAESKVEVDNSEDGKKEPVKEKIVEEKTSSPRKSPKENVDEELDMQPGTPLADEPPEDLVEESLPIQTIGREPHISERYDYHSGSRYSRSRHSDNRHYREESSSYENPISTIGTITNYRKNKYGGPFNHLVPVRQQYPNQRKQSRNENYPREREDYRTRYDRRHHAEHGSQRNSHYNRYERSPRDTRYNVADHEYPVNELEHSEDPYNSHLHVEEPSHRRPERYRTPPAIPVHIPPSIPPAIYAIPPNLPAHQPMVPVPQVFAPQPPPPGASPIETCQIAAQPPPPGVGPLLPPVASDPAVTFPSHNHTYKKDDPLKDVKKEDGRSIDDKIEAFQRELEKRDREYSRDRGSRSRSRSTIHERSRSSSRSRSYSSKSWSRSASRSTTRTSRSRSRTPFSSRSRSRSYSHSRSRSWSKPRSYSRSRSRTRTESSRSRSRSRAESRLRRRNTSRDRIRSPRGRTRSRSFSPKDYRSASHKGISSYANKHGYGPPQYGSSYQSQYGPPPVLPLPVIRPSAFPPHHVHPLHIPAPSVHTRPANHYGMERGPKYPLPYNDSYPMYDMYQPKYPQRFERDQREQRIIRYDKRQDYERQQRQTEEEIPHRIPGWVGDRSRQYRPRFREDRDQQRKEIKELPKIAESVVRVVHVKESTEESQVKKKDEKVVKHKKHHHHHKNKEVKKVEKSENKIPVVIGAEKPTEPSRNLIKVEVVSDKVIESKPSSDSLKVSKNPEKSKEKKHKHKKHKAGNEQIPKKKKSNKKEKLEGLTSTDSEVPAKVKVKKKKIKLKPVIEVKEDGDAAKEIESKTESDNVKLENEIEKVDDTTVKKETQEQSADTLNLFAEEIESEAGIFGSDAVPEADSTENVDNNLSVNSSAAEVEKTEEAVISEEEVVESVEDENVLHVDVPALSKWEREEIDDDFVAKPQRRSAVVVPKDDKGSISSDIIHRAELALLSKPFKPRIETKEKNESRGSSITSSPEAGIPKHKEVPELKSVVNSEKLTSPNLQVTILTSKDRRSVRSKKEDILKSVSVKHQSRHLKSDRSNASSRQHDEQHLHRTITLHASKIEDRSREFRDHSSDRRERRYSPLREPMSFKRTSSREGREVSRKTEWDTRRDENLNPKDDRKYRSMEYDRHPRSGDYNARDVSRSDRRKVITDHASQPKSKRPNERDGYRSFERVHKIVSYRKSRSRSLESSESHSSYKRKPSEKQHVDIHESRSREKGQNLQGNVPQRRKHSPIRAPDKHDSLSDRIKPPKRDFHDDLKFEPDYDEYSDVDERGSEAKERRKRRSTSPGVEKKRSKIEKLSNIPESVVKEKSNIVSSGSSSAQSESDSSESDEQKGSKSKNSDPEHKQKHKKSKHRKHKKHKKHKKKKSHKSKQKE
ncbi:E3 ubiquitin-protein ligase RBBP6-like, partial [Uloborus diversus]|uniref:E3 ubiquitin-protein ligase RBBP6-like n=1 Tax=Uloborus diversus TaxID=327109 RepID=UPI002409C9F2